MDGNQRLSCQERNKDPLPQPGLCRQCDTGDRGKPLCPLQDIPWFPMTREGWMSAVRSLVPFLKEFGSVEVLFSPMTDGDEGGTGTIFSLLRCFQALSEAEFPKRRVDWHHLNEN